ncbi:monovalent cation/H(+) antiporter subunit G [Skermania sp. ID1734]|uniref:monovalent cation/H(+) antiporter subunit G n=1 Tax=Skermania sp. ID1734 TaxID=2597516 RepID=UPI00117CB4D0|nr:monovalent cation/H(+) antiporter subunit G [Skermania sp. ID1734]TSD95389.1 monovalent cation/H(+) antiporter subunit G [Skermania sp. ID1734]
MSMRETIAAVLEYAGVAVVVFSGVGAVIARPTYMRLHFLTPMTSLATPLIAAALIVANGWGLTSGTVALIAVLLMLTGPALEAATARMTAQRHDEAKTESPR